MVATTVRLYILHATCLLQTFASLGKDVIVQNSRVTVQELLGGGSFGKVFKAMLRQEKQPASVSVTSIMHAIIIILYCIIFCIIQ